MKMDKRTIMVVLAGILVLSACHREYFELDKLSTKMELETGLIAPLAYGSMSMADVVAMFDSVDYIGEIDGLVYIAFDSTMVDIKMDTVDLIVDNIYFQTYFSADIGGSLPVDIGDTIHFQKDKEFVMLTAGDTRVDSVEFKGGELLTELESSFQHEGYLTVTSDDLVDANRQPLHQVIQISMPSGSFFNSVSHSLDGYYLKTVDLGDSSVFTLNYDLALINSGNPIAPGDDCEISTSFLDAGFYEAYGFLNPANLVADSGSVEIPIFEDIPELAHLKLADPRFNLSIVSSLGIPFEISVDSVFATAADGTTQELEFYSGHPFKIPAPDIHHVGERVSGEIVIDNQTSNIQELFNIAPVDISYKVSGGVDQDSPNQDHFMLDTSRFIVGLEFMLPLDLRITRVDFLDTLEFSFGEDGLDTAMIREVWLKVYTLNELPLELDLQVYFLDEYYGVIDSVFDKENEPVLLKSSTINLEGRLEAPGESEKIAEIDAAKLSKLADVQFLQLKATAVTAAEGAEYVKFYSDYTLDFDISFSGKFTIKSEE